MQQDLENTHIAMIQYLLAQDAALEAKDKYGQTALLIALSKLRLSLVHLLVQYGANVEVRDRYYGRTPLLLAAAVGRVALVQILLNENVDMEAKDDHGQTALMRAASCGHLSVVKQLVEKGAKLEPDSSSSGERTALGAAAASGWKEVTEFLLQAGAILEQKSGNGSSALTTAALRGHYDVVAILLASHGNINAVNNDGETPLLAAVKAQSQLIEHLSLIGTERLNDVPQRKRAKSAALIRELKSIILLLVSSGADIEVEDRWEETALYLAASGGLVVTTRFLLNYGANPNYVNPRSKLTPLEIASRSGHNVVAWLLTRKLSERGGSGVVSGFSIQPSLHTMAKMKEKPSGLVGFETTRLGISGLSLLLTTLYDNIKEASTWELIPLEHPKNNTGAIMPSETQPPISSHITETVSLSTHINSNDLGTKAALFFLSQTPAPPSTEPESTQLSRLDANGSDMTDKNTGRQSPVNMEDENISDEWIGERLRAVMEPANNVLKTDGVHIQAIALVGAKKVGKSSLIRQITLIGNKADILENERQ
ncbi:hypothetical protein VE03_07191, partial [Pseudogymnoascus sp. 23342-1-I1]